MCAAFGHGCRRGHTGREDLTGKVGDRLSFGRDIVAYNLIMVGNTGFGLLHIGTIGIIRHMTDLYARLDELVDGNIHLELQESRYLYVAR